MLQNSQNLFSSETEWYIPKESAIKNYNFLSVDEKQILQLKALFFKATNSENCYRMLQKLKIDKSNGEKFKVTEVTTIIKKLKAEDLLDETNNTCPVTIMHRVWKDTASLPGFLNKIRAIQQLYPAKVSYSFYKNPELLFRDFLFNLYANISENEPEFFLKQNTMGEFNLQLKNFLPILIVEPDFSWVFARQPPFKWPLVCGVLQSLINQGGFCQEWVNALEKESPSGNSQVVEILATYYLFNLNLEAIDKLVPNFDFPWKRSAFSACVYFLKNDLRTAVTLFDQAHNEYKKSIRKRKCYLPGYFGILSIFAHLALDQIQYCKTLETDIELLFSDHDTLHQFSGTFHALHKLSRKLQGLKSLTNSKKIQFGCQLDYIFNRVLFFYIQPEQKIPKEQLQNEMEFFTEAKKTGYHWLARIYGELLAKAYPKHPIYSEYLQQVQGVCLLSLLELQPDWAFILKRMQDVSQNTILLFWYLNPEERSLWVTEKPAISQTFNQSHTSFKKIMSYQDGGLALSPEDQKVIHALNVDDYGYYENDIEVNERLLLALVDHPRLYHYKQRTSRLELVPALPELHVEKKLNGDYHLQCQPTVKQNASIILQKENNSRYKIIHLTAGHRQLYAMCSETGITIPQTGKAQLLTALQKMADIATIYTSVTADNIQQVAADTQLRINLQPYAQNGLLCEIMVRPLGNEGSYFSPGEGPQSLIVKNQQQTVQVNRDFSIEKLQIAALKNHVKSLYNYNPKSPEYCIDSPQECLELLAELKECSLDIQIQWPQGQSFSVKKILSVEHLHLTIQKQNDWFSIDGRIEIDSKHVLEMRTLLHLLEQSQGRFIPLEDGSYLALTQHFKNRLLQIKALTQETKDDLRIHRLGAYSFNEIIQDFKEVQMDEMWRKTLEKINAGQAADLKLPPDLTAQLRHYQLEGFQWLCRLAQWEVGGCLADDMGLGKTLQAIAILLKRAEHGPSLVIAPTSVCHNWITEISQFSPKLRVHAFADGMRNHLMTQIKPYDVMICSYGLLPNCIEMLKKQNWQVLVLDEAQAIKNSNSQRAKCAYQLQANFKLALTGTPVENHLGELWSLFHFLNPGLLGSEKDFFRRFIVPIEQNKDVVAKECLKLLIKPFILRRLKKAVLQELPSRTEKTIEIIQSKDEMGFYQAVREQALENIAQNDNQKAGQKRIKILAEIMRLRQVCCHPALINPEITIESSKLKHLEYLLDELVTNNHKALIFSQFVSYLAIIRTLLDRKKLRYQYLDGSTPAAERKDLIQNFQAGKSDFFLLSLKAGGVGLNLTTADYVIPLDPWWNPAVEDQAADRAHRLGQQKPVTIYRFITLNTIEEKILQLHQHKRHLADDILSASGDSAQLTEEQLVSMIKNL